MSNQDNMWIHVTVCKECWKCSEQTGKTVYSSCHTFLFHEKKTHTQTQRWKPPSGSCLFKTHFEDFILGKVLPCIANPFLVRNVTQFSKEDLPMGQFCFSANHADWMARKTLPSSCSSRPCSDPLRTIIVTLSIHGKGGSLQQMFLSCTRWCFVFSSCLE